MNNSQRRINSVISIPLAAVILEYSGTWRKWGGGYYVRLETLPPMMKSQLLVGFIINPPPAAGFPEETAEVLGSLIWGKSP